MLERALRLAVVLGVVAGAVLFALNAGDMLHRDAPGDYVEGVVLSAQRTVATGGSAFDAAGWAGLPWRINLYGPVHYQVGAWALQAGGDLASLRPGRVVSLLAMALALASLWRLMRRGLDLPGGDVLAPPDDHVLDPAGDPGVAGLVDRPEVPGV